MEFAPFVEKLEALFIALLDEELLELLHAVKTKEEALNSKEREHAKEALIPSNRGNAKFFEEKDKYSRRRVW